MRSVVFIGPSIADPAGSVAVRGALQRALPNHDLVAPARPPFAKRPAGPAIDGVVVAGVAPDGLEASMASAAMAAARQRVPVACVGVPGPVRGRLRAAVLRTIAPHTRLLLAADEPSAVGLRAAGVAGPIRVGADPAWLALEPGLAGGGPVRTDRPDRTDEVAVAIDGGMSLRLERSLSEALVILARSGRAIRIVSWARQGSADDGLASRLLLTVLGAVPGGASKVAAPVSLSEAASVFSHAYAVVALRHRAVHAAAAAGVPLVGVGTDPAIVATANLFRQPVIHPDDVVTSLAVTVERQGSGSPPNRAVVDDQIRRAAAAMRLLRLVIEPDAVPAAEIDALPMEPVPWLS